MTHHSKHLGAEIAGKQDSAERAVNPAVREMIAHLGEAGVETVLDRLDAQRPQCGFGLRGTCCRMCQWGPCRITERSPRGVCGRTGELVVMANLLRAVAAGASAQTMHAHEMILAFIASLRGEIALSSQSNKRLREVGSALNIGFPWTPLEETAEKVGEAMLEDLGRMTDQPMTTLNFAPRDRRPIWEELDVLPRSVGFEVLEALHMTTLGNCSDWEAMFRQVVRTSLAFAYGGLMPSSLLSEVMFGIPEPRVVEVNYGILKPDHVNILVHGHSPVMLEKLLEKIESDEIQELALEKGAAGIVVGGMCCTGLEALGRHGVPTVTGAIGQELAIGTGAVDAVVVDMQCVIPGMAAVAECFGTSVVTTYRSNRIPGATHIPFDPEHPETLDDDAMLVARTAVEAFASRDRTKIHIPQHTTKVMAGFGRESVLNSFGGPRKLLAAIQSGEIRGIVGMVGCSSPKFALETGHVTIARELIRRGILVLASGCSAHALISAGLCTTDATAEAAPGLRAACEAAGIPPVLVVGSCSDNARIVQVFATLASVGWTPLAEMPFAVSGPELANEKTMGHTFTMLAHGITAVVGLSPQLPVPPLTGGRSAGSEVVDFLGGDGLESMLGSRLLIEPDPAAAANLIAETIEAKRASLERDAAADEASAISQ